MDCDVGIRLVHHKKRRELSIHLPAARETTEEGFTINAIVAENFAYAHDGLHMLAEIFNEEESRSNLPDQIEAPPETVQATSPLMASCRGQRDEIDDDLEI